MTSTSISSSGESYEALFKRLKDQVAGVKNKDPEALKKLEKRKGIVETIVGLQTLLNLKVPSKHLSDNLIAIYKETQKKEEYKDYVSVLATIVEVSSELPFLSKENILHEAIKIKSLASFPFSYNITFV